MKNSKKSIRIIVLTAMVLVFTVPAQGQFLKKLGKAAERAAKQTVENRVEQETSKKTDAAMDSILEPGGNNKKKNGPSITQGENQNTDITSEQNTSGQTTDNDDINSSINRKELSVYSKFDFVPGDKLLFFDDFSNDFVGDFPSNWNTNGSGEIVMFENTSEKWFEIRDGRKSYYIVNLDDLPEDYTIEFDLETLGMDAKTSSAATLAIILDDSDNFSYGTNTSYVYLPFYQNGARGIRVWNSINGENLIDNTIDADIREDMGNRPHISIAVNGQRLRLFVNEKKHVDIPRMIGEGGPLKSLKFQVDRTTPGKERVFLKNIKIAAGGVDLRRKLISEGKVSTNGILFDSGSDTIKPESMGIIRQISQVLHQETGMDLKIIGHTDADGKDDINMKLSKNRAEAVKKVLTTIYSISESRLITEGKGQLEPLSDNTTADGKAQNRRVEFIKQ